MFGQEHVHYRPKLWNILKPNGNTRIWYFDFLEMARYQPQPSIVALMHLSCIVLGRKIQLVVSEIKATQDNLWASVIFQYLA